MKKVFELIDDTPIIFTYEHQCCGETHRICIDAKDRLILCDHTDEDIEGEEVEQMMGGNFISPCLKIQESIRYFNNALVVQACENNDPELLELAILCGSDINYGEGLAVVSAAKNNLTELLKKAIGLGADVNISEGHALRWASAKGHLDIVKLLLSASADPTAKNNEPILSASAEYNSDVVIELVKAGADINAGKYRPLIDASFNKDEHLVRFLLNAGATVKRSWHSERFFHTPELCTPAIKAMTFAAIDERGVRDTTRLEAVCSIECCNDIHQIGVDDEKKRVYLLDHERGEIEDWRAEAMLGNDLCPCIKLKDELERDSDSVLLNSTKGEHADLVAVAIAAGANINAYNGLPLRNACETGSRDVVKLLIDNGVNVLQCDSEALKLAAKRGQPDIVELLFQNGCTANQNNYVAFRHAAIRGHIDVLAIFFEHGCTITEEWVSSYHSVMGDDVFDIKGKVIKGIKAAKELQKDES